MNLINRQIDDRSINENVVAYITGFFDGEGTIGVYKRNSQNSIKLEINIANTNLEVLKRIKNVFSGEINNRSSSKRYSNRKKAWQWIIGNRYKQKFFLEHIFPYLIVKKSQVELGLEYLERTSESQGECLSQEESTFRESYINKFKIQKHYFYTTEEVERFNSLIKTTKHSQIVIRESVYSYIAGFFDAEGSVGAYFNKNNNDIILQVSISNTYPFILIKLKSIFGGNVNIEKRQEKSLKWKKKWIWRTLAINDVKFFLTKILPYSIAKKPQIELGLKFLETDNYQTKILIADELMKMKDIEYTDEEICSLNKQIDDMNVDKLQHKLADYK